MERLARWLWRRWGHRASVMLPAVAVVVCIVTLGPTGIAAMVLLFDLSLADTVPVIARVLVIFVPVSFLVVLLPTARYRRATQAWVRGDRSDPLGAQRAAFAYARVTALWNLAVQVPLQLGLVVPDAADRYGLDRAGTAVLAGSFALLMCVGVLLVAVSFDLVLRPWREEVAALMPGAPPPVARGWGAGGRLLLSSIAMSWAGGVLTAALVTRFDSPTSRFAAASSGALVVSVVLGVGIFGVFMLRPVLRPIRDLRDGTRRVAAGDYATPLPVTADDELGELVASFNGMQAGLLERERLHAAFGSYVDPSLAARLLAQGDDLFAGEEVDVTILFADVRDFTPYAEAHEPAVAVGRLNALFEVVVPALREFGGHANKYLGDGVLAVFGVPEQLADHADRAVAAAVEIQRRVRDAFGEELRIGIGLNSGRVIAGTIGGGGKLEFTLIGDAVNVAARVEERTKETGDPILVTDATLARLRVRPEGLVDRGAHTLRGKGVAIALHGLDPFAEVAPTS